MKKPVASCLMAQNMPNWRLFETHHIGQELKRQILFDTFFPYCEQLCVSIYGTNDLKTTMYIPATQEKIDELGLVELHDGMLGDI